MDRKEELMKYLKQNNADEILISPIVDDFVFLESRLDELRKLPFIKINPKNPAQQKTTPAAKLYKECLQQYTNILKVLSKTAGADSDDEDSPLRKWVKAHVNNS